MIKKYKIKLKIVTKIVQGKTTKIIQNIGGKYCKNEK